MEYRRVDKTGWDVSALSFGCMRFKDDESAAIAVRKAIELGVNYFDVAPLYGGGTAEPRLATGLKNLRDEAIVTAKSSPGNGGTELCDYAPEKGFGIRTADEARRQIERSMQILGVDHLDMYQFWACHSEEVFVEGLKPGGFMEGVLKARDEGLFDYIGMTTHSESAEIIHFIKDSPYEFDMVTLPLSPVNAGRGEAIEYCVSRGIGVIAMNPLGGGRLGRPVPILASVAASLGCQSMIDASLRYVAGYPGVTSALNGITLADHAVQGVKAIARGPLPGGVGEQLVARLGELYNSVNPRHLCTACGYCGQCPQGIEIPEVLDLYTGMLVPSLAQAARKAWDARIASDASRYAPAACTRCGQCEAKCPNKIPVSELMAAAAALRGVGVTHGVHLPGGNLASNHKQSLRCADIGIGDRSV